MDQIPVINALRELQKISKPVRKTTAGSSTAQVSAKEEALRALVPTSILAHFDRVVRTGRVGIAPVRSGVCGGCHIRVPRSQSASMRGSHEIDLCDQCGAFLFSEEMLAEAAERPAETVA